jgi:hypothetical protein
MQCKEEKSIFPSGIQQYSSCSNLKQCNSFLPPLYNKQNNLMHVEPAARYITISCWIRVL